MMSSEIWVGGSGRLGVRRWQTLSHDGVEFPDDDDMGHVEVMYRGRALDLSDDAKRYAVAFDRIKNAHKSPLFLANFWDDWSKLVPVIDKGIETLRDIRIVVGPTRKKRPGVRMHARVDGKRQPMLNYKVDGAGVFVGRANHPLSGRLRRAVRHRDVTLNLDEGAAVPPGDWAAIIHNPFVDWLASWRDPLLGVIKYTRLAHNAQNEQEVDRQKYDRARELAGVLPVVLRRSFGHMHGSGNIRQRQLATCVHLIYMFAFRIGDASSDTRARGLTSLQTKHISMAKHRSTVRFDFAGKDGVPYRRNVRIASPLIRANLHAFVSKKGEDGIVFDQINPDLFNAYLTMLAGKGYSARDLRTCRANMEYEASLSGGKSDALVLANARVAFLCNHRRRPGGVPVDDQVARLLDEGSAKEAIRLGRLSLTTSLTNYIDPRIPLAFCARHGLPRSAAYRTKQLRKKFSWASGDPNYRFWDHRPVTTRPLSA